MKLEFLLTNELHALVTRARWSAIMRWTLTYLTADDYQSTFGCFGGG